MMSQAVKDWVSFLRDLEKEVVEGRHEQAKAMIQNLNPRKIPRESASVVADFAWRMSEPLWTLKILSPILFPENELRQDATDREKLIYATALGNLGAVREALEIFQSIDSQKEPEVLLRQALAHFRSWDYPSAIGPLSHFLKNQNLPAYRRLVGKVNLAAALVTNSRLADAEIWLQEIQAECEQNQYWLLLGNCLELQGQVCFFKNEFHKAMEFFDRSLQLLAQQGGEFSLYSEKWKAICQAFQKKDSTSFEELRNLRLKAFGLGQWETVRDCDLFEAIIADNEALARKVIWGTPFSFYKVRARRLLGRNFLKRGVYHWHLGELEDAGKSFVFDPYEFQKSGVSLHQNPALLALFKALTMDFYKPSHIGLIFQRVYPSEKFNPFTSPGRVLKLIRRLDLWFLEQKVPLQIRMKKSEFAIQSRNQAFVRIRLRAVQNLSKQQGHYFQLQQLFKERTFNIQAVSAKLGVSRSSAQSLMKAACEEGIARRQGVGRSTIYSLVPRAKKKAAA